MYQTDTVKPEMLLYTSLTVIPLSRAAEEDKTLELAQIQGRRVLSFCVYLYDSFMLTPYWPSAPDSNTPQDQLHQYGGYHHPAPTSQARSHYQNAEGQPTMQSAVWPDISWPPLGRGPEKNGTRTNWRPPWKKCGLNPSQLEDTAAQRSIWLQLCQRGVQKLETSEETWSQHHIYTTSQCSHLSCLWQTAWIADWALQPQENSQVAEEGLSLSHTMDNLK